MNHIINADCVEAMKTIKDCMVDMILCDLPYGTTNCGWDQVIPFGQLWDHYKRIIKENGAIVLFAQQPFATDLINSNRKWFRYEWIWEKTKALGFLNARKMPLRCYENILVFYKKLPLYNPQFGKGKPYVRKGSGKIETKIYHVREWKETETIINKGTRYPRDVIHMPSNRDEKFHPTQKPVELLEYLIKTYTRPGEVVLDNCIGAGSTAIAAIRTGRQFIGIERDKRYAQIACIRCEKEYERIGIAA